MHCPSLILCDHVYVNDAEGKTYILGAYSAILVSALPHARSLFVVFEVTGAEGEVVFEITVAHEPTGSPAGVLRSSARSFRTPRVVGQLSLPIDVTLQLPGRWATEGERGQHGNPRRASLCSRSQAQTPSMMMEPCPMPAATPHQVSGSR